MSGITIEQAISCLQKNPGNDILDPDTMQSLLMANKIDKVRKLHTSAITPPNEEGGRWQTYYKDSTGKRKCLKAGTENELLLKLVDVYFNKKQQQIFCVLCSFRKDNQTVGFSYLRNGIQPPDPRK